MLNIQEMFAFFDHILIIFLRHHRRHGCGGRDEKSCFCCRAEAEWSQHRCVHLHAMNHPYWQWDTQKKSLFECNLYGKILFNNWAIYIRIIEKKKKQQELRQRRWKCKFPSIFENYDRPTNQNKPTILQTDKRVRRQVPLSKMTNTYHHICSLLCLQNVRRSTLSWENRG